MISSLVGVQSQISVAGCWTLPYVCQETSFPVMAEKAVDPIQKSIFLASLIVLINNILIIWSDCLSKNCLTLSNCSSLGEGERDAQSMSSFHWVATGSMLAQSWRQIVLFFGAWLTCQSIKSIWMGIWYWTLSSVQICSASGQHFLSYRMVSRSSLHCVV